LTHFGLPGRCAPAAVPLRARCRAAARPLPLPLRAHFG